SAQYARIVATGTAARTIRIGVVGCGDVARRRYVPALASLGDAAEVVGCFDRDAATAERLVALARGTWPATKAFGSLGALLAAPGLDAIVNLTPAPVHGVVSQTCLDAGVHVYSEKPIAASVEEADALIATASRRGLTLLCAPGEAVSRRGRWLKEIVDSGRFGPLTLAVAHHADSGPATWREYTGDPTVFYGPGVGPVFDHGVYRLHLMTSLLGAVRRVQAMGSISRPNRMVRAGPLLGNAVPVTAPDHVLVNLEFANGALGQLLASFGSANTKAPWLELHFSDATLSYGGQSSDPDAPASIFLDDDSPLGLEGWIDDLRPPPPDDGLGSVEAGIVHFVRCLRGEETPVLTAEHARHVLDITLKAYESIADGQSHETTTTF
ncbi:MAG TPA: Gfo/Idh/MocA family oxidoreductase, partial [Candidatus Limnocylindrales bacterium]